MISVIVPVYNEEEILEWSVHRIRRFLGDAAFDYEILVVSNGSDDRTVDVGQRLAQEYDECRFIVLEKRGAGRAFVAAAQKAKGEYLVCLDADLSSDLSFITEAHDLLQKSCDAVIGSKTLGTQRRGFVRVAGSHAYIFCAQFFFDVSISDYSIGCKAFRKQSITGVLDHLDGWTGHIFELCLYLQIQRRRIVQVAINCDDRRKSHFNLGYEGLYRFRHLYYCRKLIRNKQSWLYTSRASASKQNQNIDALALDDQAEQDLGEIVDEHHPHE